MSKYSFVYGEDYIQINRYGKEVLYWDSQEWVDDPSVVFSICNAIWLAGRNELDTILKEIKRIK